MHVPDLEKLSFSSFKKTLIMQTLCFSIHFQLYFFHLKNANQPDLVEEIKKREGANLCYKNIVCIMGVCVSCLERQMGRAPDKRRPCKCQALRQSQERNENPFVSFAVATHGQSYCSIPHSSATNK